MKALKYFLGMAFLLAVVAGCKKDTYTDVAFLETATAPDKLAALFEITQDNTGLVTITPNGEGGTSYDIFFGDGTAAPVSVKAGGNTQHKYAEGVYTVKMVAHNITGKTTETTKQLTVSFRAPENLDAKVDIDAANTFKVNVSATALYETVFRVYFGDVPNEQPQSFNEGTTVTHTYTATGTYNVRVVALSGGVATTEIIKPVTIVDPVVLPITFESATVVYNWGGFGGANAGKIANPDKSGINTSNFIGRMVKGAPEVWAGAAITLANPINFSANKIWRMKVWSPRVGAKVLFKVENLTDGAIFFEKEVASTIANGWEDLAIDFSAINTANSYQKVVLIFDLGTAGNGTANYTWYFDDIRQVASLPTTNWTLPANMDDPNGYYGVIDFEGAVTVDAADPTNASNKVKRSTKPTGAQPWAGTTMGSGFATKLPFTATNTSMTVKVYSPAAGLKVRLKVENRANNTITCETDATTTVANAWETLTFNFATPAAGTAALNLANTYDMGSIFFDFLAAASGKVFFWDDVAFVTTAPPPPTGGVALPLDFQSTTLTYAFTDFNGGGATVVNNPSATGINTSTKVGKMVKSAGEVYGGSWIAMASPISFATTKTFKMKVWSPKVGTKVLLKVENMTNGAIAFEKEVTTATANAWELLTFDFSAIDATKSYQKVVLIFDLGTMGDGGPNFTYYFDDITLN